MFEQGRGSGKALLVAVFYFTCSISMNFLNKAVVSSYDFNYPFFIMACQMVATVIFLDISRLLKLSKLSPYSLKEGVDFLPASLSFALHSTLSLIALHGMNIPMYGGNQTDNTQQMSNEEVFSNQEMYSAGKPDLICDDPQQTISLRPPHLQHCPHHCGGSHRWSRRSPVRWTRLHHGNSLSICTGGSFLHNIMEGNNRFPSGWLPHSSPEKF